MIDLEDVIRSHGFAVQAVHGISEPSFAYTIGLNDRVVPFPEFIMIGLNPKIIHHLIHWTINWYEVMKEIPKVGDMPDVANHPMLMGAVSDENIVKYLCQAVYRAERNDTLPVTALQMIWTDEEGRFPDNPDFNESMRKSQPLLA